ncbi:hypothetical protein [Streptomyces sp. SM14]|uniref:hypothetical protein n=1 Tax=Streptomyces sp. SM14 TaxID=1736045 RepID=UPI000CD50EAC|nr:hypothetical protein [Streptomyces sp. SM14]
MPDIEPHHDEEDAGYDDLERATRPSDNSFLGLAWRLGRLATAAGAVHLTVTAGQARAARNAAACRAMADAMTEAHVAPRHVAALQDVASNLELTAGATTEMAHASDELAAAAAHARDEHRAEYGDIYDEAQHMASKGDRQPKPGFFAH